MGISRPTAYKWWRRWQAEGIDGLVDRSSRPKSCPHQTSSVLEGEIAELRRELKLGPARIGSRLGVAASTVHKVLVRLGLNRLSWIDRPTGQVIRRYERDAPGDLVHVDIKKLGLIPDGGGWWAHGREAKVNYNKKHVRRGYAFIHSAVDDHSRLAFSEVLPNERQETVSEFWRHAAAFFADHGVTVREVITDNGSAYRSRMFTETLGPVAHRFTRPYRPQTNGKVERFNRTLLEEWAYVRPYASETDRTAAFAVWLHLYNYHRNHTALGGKPPVSRVSNLSGHYI